MLICLCSKNEEADVWSAFDQRDDFKLERNTIVAAAVNWLPKSQNIRQLASDLNLGLDSFVFLDDNPGGMRRGTQWMSAGLDYSMATGRSGCRQPSRSFLGA